MPRRDIFIWLDPCKGVNEGVQKYVNEYIKQMENEIYWHAIRENKTVYWQRKMLEELYLRHGKIKELSFLQRIFT